MPEPALFGIKQQPTLAAGEQGLCRHAQKTGDPDQTDLLPGISGLGQIAERLSTLEDISVIRLEERDIVRHPLVAAMLTVL